MYNNMLCACIISVSIFRFAKSALAVTEVRIRHFVDLFYALTGRHNNIILNTWSIVRQKNEVNQNLITTKLVDGFYKITGIQT